MNGRMKIVSLDEAAGAPVIVALGFFDGVHVGHQRLVATTIERARALGVEAALLTFKHHPMQVVRPESAPLALTTFDEKIAVLATTGLDATICCAFDAAFSQLSPEAFVNDVVVARLGAVGVVAGPNYRFGAGGRGDVPLLESLGAKAGVGVDIVAPVELDGGLVSSTRIRTCVAEGAVEEAARLLGRPYFAYGRVVHGDKRGRTIGFPTANLEVGEGKLLPADGVYAVRVRIGDAWHDGVANLGVRPTFGERRRVLEAHLFGVDADLYGREAEIAFARRIREERRFDDVRALIAQIDRDVEAAREML